MSCPRCHTQNPPVAKFCMQCGLALTQRCPNCQSDLALHSRTCSNCGQLIKNNLLALPIPVAAPSLRIAPRLFNDNHARLSRQMGERRVVTIMFADISGFTAISERMDPEQVRNLMNNCFDHLVPVVEKYGGVVDKFIGDEIMALFGAPVAHEDDPVRALRAALEMMDVLAQFNAEHDIDLDLHAGINTGLVVAGGIGSRGRQQYSVMGDAVNLAARLEAASERGEILFGPDTHRLVAPLFEFETLAPIQVKGKRGLIQVYKLLDLKADPGRLRGLVGLESPLVGRERELVNLQQVAEQLQGGQGQVILIIGEAGLGKSRLVSEWRGSVGLAKQQWVEARCLSYGQGLAYHLLIDLLRALLGISSGASKRESQAMLQTFVEDLCGGASCDMAPSEMTPFEVVPYLGHLLSLPLDEEAQRRVAQQDPQTLQNQYLAAMRYVLEKLTARQPLGLIFEDIHWADPSSTDLLIKLLPLINELPLFFCFVTRPDYDVSGWRLVTTAREQFARQVTEINLHTLSEAESRTLISHLLEIESLPEHIRTLILKRAEGNPFFVEEVIRMLIEQKAIIRDGKRWVACEVIETVEIPDSLQGLLLARIDRLPEEIKHTLRIASVIGRQFSGQVLNEVLKAMQPEAV